MDELPSAVLFCCTYNVIRSPMAEGILKRLYGTRIYADSVGITKGEPDPFVPLVMEEIGVDLSRHRPKTFDDLQDQCFDLVITFSPKAHHKAIELTRTLSCEVEYWPTFDPSLAEGSRDARLDAYRAVRDVLFEKLRVRFAR